MAEPKQAPESKQQAKKESEKSQDDNTVDTNAGADAAQGTIADVDPEQVRKGQ